MENIHLGLSDLLDQDLTSYEYFQSLSDELKRKVMEQDVRSWEELQSLVAKERFLSSKEEK